MPIKVYICSAPGIFIYTMTNGMFDRRTFTKTYKDTLQKLHNNVFKSDQPANRLTVKMLLSFNFLLALAYGDLIGFNRLANNRMYHSIGRFGAEYGVPTARLQLLDHFIKTGQIALAKRFLETVRTAENKRRSAPIHNLDLLSK